VEHGSNSRNNEDGRGGKLRLAEQKTILALLKWVYNAEVGSLSLSVRTDSQGLYDIPLNVFFFFKLAYALFPVL
jgi:hypothetical protein